MMYKYTFIKYVLLNISNATNDAKASTRRVA